MTSLFVKHPHLSLTKMRIYCFTQKVRSKWLILSLTIFFTRIPAYAVLTVPTQLAPVDGSIGNQANALIDWSTVSGADAYQYRYDTDPAMSQADTVTVSLFSQSNAVDLLFGATYYWQVRAISTIPADSSAWSTIWTFTTLDQITLAAPIDGAVSQPPDVLLDWNTVFGITNYDYELDTVNTFNSAAYLYGSVGTTSQVYTSNLYFGANYYWRVRARHSADTTQWSPARLFKTVNTVALVAPVNGAVNVAPDVLLDWSPVSGVSDYQFQYDTASDFSSINLYSGMAGSVSQANCSNLFFDTQYYWRVRAIHAADTSDWSLVRSFNTTGIINLVSPVQNAVDVAPDVLLDWSTLTGIASYEFQHDTAPDFSSPIFYSGNSGNVSQANTQQLLFGTVYYWRVRAMHSADTTAWSSVRTFTTTDTLYLTAPVNGAVNVVPDVLLDWSPISGVSGYQCEYDTTSDFSSGASVITTVGNVSQTNASNLYFGTVYYWRARALHSYDTTGWSAVRSFSTVSRVNLLAPIDGATGVSLNPLLDWTTMSGVSGYQYRFDTDSNFSQPIYGAPVIISQSNLSSLQYGTTYFWQARAFHAIDSSDWSMVYRFTTVFQLTIAPTLVSPPDATTNIQTLGTSLVWNPLPSVTGYECEVADNLQFQNPILVTSTVATCNTGALASNRTYYWRVRGSNGSGYSPWSAVWSFTTINTTGVEEAEQTAKLTVHPNPASTKISIGNLKSTGIVRVTDPTGRLLLQQAVDRTKEVIDISLLPPGIYLMVFIDQECERNARFIKE
jgi:hypothetical protein